MLCYAIVIHMEVNLMQDAVDEISDETLFDKTMKSHSEIELNFAEAHKATAEAILAAKKARWYELVIFGGAGITIGLALGKLLLA